MKALAIGLLGHNVMVYVALLLVPLAWWLLARTRFGLRLRAAGENPAMVDAAGVSVQVLRYAALALNGVLCALAGCYLVLAQNPSFIPHMTAGRGYMALAAMIFGKWQPVGALWACLLFGFLDAAAIRLQGVPLPGIGAVPVQAIQALPYVMTVVLLAGFIGARTRAEGLGCTVRENSLNLHLQCCHRFRNTTSPAWSMLPALCGNTRTHRTRASRSELRCSTNRGACTPVATSRTPRCHKACAPRRWHWACWWLPVATACARWSWSAKRRRR